MRKNILLALALGLAALGASPAIAAGAFDFLDPCIKARSEFADQHQQIRSRVTNFENSIATMVADAEFHTAWMSAKRNKPRPIFDAAFAPTRVKLGATD